MSVKARLDKLEEQTAQSEGGQLLPLTATVAIQSDDGKNLFHVTQGGEAARMMTREQVAELGGPTIVIHRSELATGASPEF